MRELADAIERKQEFRIHPLGFYFLQDYISSTKRATRRIHVWLSNGPNRPANDQHTHAFDLESLVVTGTLRNELFQFKENKHGSTTEFKVSYRSSESTLNPTGRRGNLEQLASFITLPGSRYQLKAGVIHRAVTLDLPCVSVLSTHLCEDPIIYSYGTSAEDRPFLRRFVDHDEASKIACILEEILHT